MNLDNKIQKTTRLLNQLLIIISICSVLLIIINSGFDKLTDWVMIFVSAISAYIIWKTLNSSIESQKTSQINFNKEQVRVKKESFFNYLDKERSYLQKSIKQIRYRKTGSSTEEYLYGLNAIMTFNKDCDKLFKDTQNGDLLNLGGLDKSLQIRPKVKQVTKFLKQDDYYILLNSLERVCEYTKVTDINYLNYFRDRDIIMFIDSVYFTRHVISMLQNLIKVLDLIKNEQTKYEVLEYQVDFEERLRKYSHLL